MDNYIYSFDIFDTCLIRTCGSSECVWDILAHNVLGTSANSSLINDFILIRRSGEGQARKNLISDSKEDVTIDDIYSYCDFSPLTKRSNQDIMEAEIEVENKVLVPVLSTLHEISQLHQEGKHVVFISDMYLPYEFVQKKLKDVGLLHHEDKLFISGDVGKAKSTGHLYDYVCHELQADFKKWKHQGDNQHSDYDIPRKKGIHAILVNHAKSYYEHKALENVNGLSSSDMYKISSISRAIRLGFENTPKHLFAADFIAPMMTTFVHHIFIDASKRGIKHLYFVARDACILYHIAQQFSHIYPDISIHYLYASRKSLYLPGLKNYSFDELHKIDSEVEDSDALREQYEEQCLLTIGYFRQEGLTRPNCAIVDMVGGRRCQKSINTILSRNGYKEIYAYYYEVVPYRIMACDEYSAMFYQERMGGSPYYHHASHPLFEQYFGITDQLRTISYRKEGQSIIPVFENDLVNIEYKQSVFNINRHVCCAFAGHYVNSFITSPQQCNHLLYAVFAQFCHVPRREYLKALYQFFSTSSSSTKEPLLEKRSILSLLFNKSHYVRWKNGNLIFNSGILYYPILSLLQMYYNRKKRKSV